MRAALLALLLAAGCRAKEPPRRGAEEAISRARAYLWSRQAPSGGWHSETYGLLRSGQSLTPFVLFVLLERASDPAAVERAVRFLLTHVDAEGSVGRIDPAIDDYPNYATSLAVRALLRAGRDDRVRPLVECLRRQQFAEHLGWKEDLAAYGAWGMGGPARRPPVAGHVDLSMTRHVLQALPDGDPALARAAIFLRRCQNEDGGFHFSNVVPEASKAGPARSYGTATADGILALLATCARPDDPRVRSALRWLVEHHRTDRVPGLGEEQGGAWKDAMIYYYFAAAAEVFRRLGVREAPPGRDWRREMTDALVARQRPDGSWVNPVALMKEDDPLIATALALSALLFAR